MRSEAKPVEILWDVDDGVLIIGDDIEFRTTEPLKFVNWLRAVGVPVKYRDHDRGAEVLLGALPYVPKGEYNGPKVQLKIEGALHYCVLCNNDSFRKNEKTWHLYKCVSCTNLVNANAEEVLVEGRA